MRASDWEAQREAVCDLIDVVEEWLMDRGFKADDFPNIGRSDDPEGNEEAIIWGEDYYTLEEGFTFVLNRRGLFPNPDDR